MKNNLSSTAEKAINAYGGISVWQTATYIEAEVSAKGLVFSLKGRPFCNHARIISDVHRPFSRIMPIGNDVSIAGVLDGHDVRLEDLQGERLSERFDARQYFSSVRKIIRWDDLDMAYFANYAFWNYFTLPALLMRKDIKWEEIAPGVLDGEFPESIPTHCTRQRFIFDRKTGRLVQHNYTADIISRFAKAANVILAHSQNGR